MGKRHRSKGSLARRLTKLEDRHRRDITRLRNEMISLVIQRTPAPPGLVALDWSAMGESLDPVETPLRNRLARN